MTTVTLHEGDNRATLRRLIDQGVRVHSAVMDPPYGLVSIEKRFGKEGSAPARRENNDGSFARLSGGFMGKHWDASGIERDPEFWKLVYDILLPGGYVFAFSGSRTGHWQACAMELAGFIMHPMHGWCYGSGLAKDHDAAKAIDKSLGVIGETVPKGNPVKRMIPGADQHKTGSWIKDNGRVYQPGTYIPATEQAEQWDGWAYGTQAQKPAIEPIYLAQKPFSEKTGPANLMKHGVGAVNIDGCRVGNRHPANLLLDGSPEVVAMFPANAGARARVRGTEPSSAFTNVYNARNRKEGVFHSDEGSAARFFHQFRYACDRCQDEGQIVNGAPPDGCWVETCPVCEGRAGLLPNTQPLIYNGKAAKADRAGSDHPTVKPISLLRYLVRHITPPGGIVLDPFAGTGTTAVAAQCEGFDCILMEAEPEYIEFLRKRFDLGAAEGMFDDLLGYSTKRGSVDQFEDLLG